MPYNFTHKIMIEVIFIAIESESNQIKSNRDTFGGTTPQQKNEIVAEPLKQWKWIEWLDSLK